MTGEALDTMLLAFQEAADERVRNIFVLAVDRMREKARKYSSGDIRQALDEAADAFEEAAEPRRKDEFDVSVLAELPVIRDQIRLSAKLEHERALNQVFSALSRELDRGKAADTAGLNRAGVVVAGLLSKARGERLDVLLKSLGDHDQTPEEARAELVADGVDVDAFLEDAQESAELEAAENRMTLCDEDHDKIVDDDCCAKCGWGMK